MNWGFVLGCLIGGSLGFVITGLIAASHDNKKYIELDSNEKKNEVEE